MLNKTDVIPAIFKRRLLSSPKSFPPKNVADPPCFVAEIGDPCFGFPTKAFGNDNLNSLKHSGVTLFLSILSFFFSFCYFSSAFASDFHYDAKGKRDPFLSPAEASLLKKQIGPGELHLEGIIIDQQAASYVVVNREVVKAGETFSGFLLKKIEPNAATFEKDGEAFVLFLREDERSTANQNTNR